MAGTSEMHKPPRESKMLDEVRRWRGQAFARIQKGTPAENERRTQEWADKLGLPLLEDQTSADLREAG